MIAEYEFPEDAVNVSGSVDRTSLPIGAPRERPPRRRKKSEPRTPVSRELRVAWCATPTIHDRDGDAANTNRYGRIPKDDQLGLCEANASDVDALLKKNPRPKMVTPADGAPEILRLLDEHIGR